MSQKEPNVVLVITDDQGYGDLACHGNPVALTPNLDALHGESMRFVDFHAAPMCTPTRGQLLTGVDAARNGAVNVSSGRSLLRAELPTVAGIFGDCGYRTGLFGKWHLGDNYPYRPQDRGFQESLWFPSSHISSLPDYWENDYFDDVYCHNGERVRQEGYCTEVFFSRAKEWMRQQIDAGEPFLTFLPTNAPHYPLWVPADDREAVERMFDENEHLLPAVSDEIRPQIIRFLAMIRNLDTQVGLLREFLRDSGAERDTILIFMTDNGSTFGPAYFNAGMRGGKAQLWEGGHRVPCFVRWPNGNLGDPHDVPGLTQVQDILPTLIDLCGLDPAGEFAPSADASDPAAGEFRFDGISLADTLRGDSPVPEDRTLFVNYSRMPHFLDYPTPASPSIIRREGSAVLWKRWRLIEGSELYDLDSDPEQKTDVAEQHLDVVDRLTARLDTWWDGVEPVANEVQRITIGHDAENPTMLSACEWMDVFVDQQSQVRKAVRKNSYWHLNVDRAGSYTFELRRWPRESNLKLREGCGETEVTDGLFELGVALPITRARIYVGNYASATSVAAEDDAALFQAELGVGPVLLHTWFDDEAGEPICGAYYVYVERQ